MRLSIFVHCCCFALTALAANPSRQQPERANSFPSDGNKAPTLQRQNSAPGHLMPHSEKYFTSADLSKSHVSRLHAFQKSTFRAGRESLTNLNVARFGLRAAGVTPEMDPGYIQAMMDHLRNHASSAQPRKTQAELYNFARADAERVGRTQDALKLGGKSTRLMAKAEVSQATLDYTLSRYGAARSGTRAMQILRSQDASHEQRAYAYADMQSSAVKEVTDHSKLLAAYDGLARARKETGKAK